MKITQEVRDYAEQKGLEPAEAVTAGMEEKAAEFRARGGEVYSAPPESGSGSKD
jgi:phosphomethylpyrimidine synthase